MDKKTVYGINKSKGTADFEKRKHLNRSYERHFEGYDYHVELTSEGKERLIRTYTGDYYEADQPPRMRAVRKLVYLVLYGISVALLILYGRFSDHSAAVRFLAVPEMLTLFAILWLGTKLVFYMTAPQKMTVGEYKGSCVALKSAAKAAAAIWAANAVLFLVAAVVSACAARDCILPFVSLCLGCAVTALIYSMEQHLRYLISSSGQ